MNKSKVDRIFELLPTFLNARDDANWSSLVSAIGTEDQRLANLIEEVRKQFFVKTASRPYIDRLAANSNLNRPRFVGMSDIDFRRYIPILSYQPKQVKKIIDELLDLFFFKEATTAFLSSGVAEPFVLSDNWSFQLLVDNIYLENIVFRAVNFGDITAATADAVAAAYNRQAKYSYAISYFDSITKFTYIRIFTKTIGAQGSMLITGGLACIGLEPNGFLSDLGTGNNTQWLITKIGNTMTFKYNAGIQPGIEFLQVGDLFFSDLTGNVGSFTILTVDIEDKSFTFENILGTAGTITQTSDKQTKFLRPVKVISYNVPRRALLWETTIGSATIELPVTPPIVQRELQGGFHINGEIGLVTEINSATSLTVVDATGFPASGNFIIEPIESITARLTGGDADEIVTYNNQGRVISNFIRYSYTGISGNTLTGITPDLPEITALNEATITSMSKTSEIVTATVANDFSVGDMIFIRGSSGIPILTTTGDKSAGSSTINNLASLAGVSPGQLVTGPGITTGSIVIQVVDPTTIVISKPVTLTALASSVTFSENTNGPFEVQSATSTQFTFNQLGIDGSVSVPGTVSKESLLLAPDGFRIIVMTSVSSDVTEIQGTYVWDLNAPFVLSADTSTLTNDIIAGKIVKLLEVDTDAIPEGDGFFVIDYGQNNQEGPIRYLYKPADNILAVDPSYIFRQNHEAGASVVAVSKLGPHVPRGFGDEYPPYATNPPDARIILQNLITSVASAGIFIDFIVRYPNQLYGTIQVYGE